MVGLDCLPQEVFLAHLSHENNKPQLAFDTIDEMLKKANAQETVELYVTRQDIMVSNMDRRLQDE